MKRLLIATVAGLALAVPSSAQAVFFAGPVAGGVNNAGVELKVSTRHGRPRKVTQFEWHNVPVSSGCYDSEIYFKKMSVSHLRFHGSGHPGKRGNRNYPVNRNVTATIKGKFKNHRKKVVGTLRLQGTFAGGCTNVDSGSLSYVATRQKSQP
jgi:hypothetical protein